MSKMKIQNDGLKEFCILNTPNEKSGIFYPDTEKDGACLRSGKLMQHCFWAVTWLPEVGEDS